MRRSMRWSLAGRSLVASWVVVGATGCDNNPDPLVGPNGTPAAATAEPQQNRPFYFYQGRAVYLKADPERIVVVAPGIAPPDLSSQVLSRHKISVSRVEALAQAREHWLVSVSPGAGADAARAAVADLRREKRYPFVSMAYKTEEGDHDVVLLNEVIVRFKNGVTRQEIDDLNETLGTAILREPRPDSGFFEYRLSYPADSTSDPLAIAAVLDRHPLVQWADPNTISNRSPTAVPSDPYYPLEWHLNSTTTRNGIRVNINVEPAWNITLGGGIPSQGGIRVGVIGDGVQANHPDFGSKVQAGYDGVLGRFGVGCSDCATSPFGNDSHETHVAGIITGQHNNGRGIAGIAPGALIIPARIFRTQPNGTRQVASNAEIANSINFVWQLGGADAINNSWGGGSPSNAITNAINQAHSSGRGGKGTLVVFAAGNTSDRRNGIIGPVQYPATLSNVVAVGAINRSGELTNYAPEGSQLDIVAPSGHDTDRCVGEIVTADLSASAGCNNGPNGDINYSSTFSGTSAAAPQVAAAAALLYSTEYSLTVSQARSRILGAADSWGPATKFGVGKLNVFRIFPPPPTPFVVTATAPGNVTAKGTYSLTGSASHPASGWRWERSDNGGATWTQWATTQNSTFFVFAGEEYTVQWRLFAQRTSDAATDFGFATTNVCTVTGGCGPQLAPVPSAPEVGR